ncbi:MAG: RnfABCDGE type electron transport complex subunit D, partial [Eubacteriales bacterium]
DMFLGKTGGCLGETCALAILIGGIYLILRRVISPVIPVTYLATAALFSFLFGRDPLFDLLSGGLMLGAFFMATDYTTSPLYFWGRVVFAVGCGALTLVIREFGSLPEGVSYSIILMNIYALSGYIKPRLAVKKKGRRRREIMNWTQKAFFPLPSCSSSVSSFPLHWQAPTC